MQILMTFDADDYQNTTEVFEKYTVRGIIVQNGKLAMQRSKQGEYKIPGGGPEPGEDFRQALVREVHEETGLHIIGSSVRELGEILELRRDIFEAHKKFVCHSLFYFCEVGEERDELTLTPSEAARGYHLEWASPEEICEGNKPFLNEPWIARDTAFVRMIAEKKILLSE